MEKKLLSLLYKNQKISKDNVLSNYMQKNIYTDLRKEIFYIVLLI